MVVIGIDLGLTGAVGFVDSQSCAVADLQIADDGLGRRIDGRALSNLLLEHVRVGQDVLAAFEDVQPRPMGNSDRHGNSMHSQGSLMRSRGIVEGVLSVLGIRWIVVQPQAWKDWYGLLRTDKRASVAKANLMFPTLGAQLGLVKHQNRAEALLIAHYVLRTRA